MSPQAVAMAFGGGNNNRNHPAKQARSRKSPPANNSAGKTRVFPQPVKPSIILRTLVARVNSCPDTKPRFMRSQVSPPRRTRDPGHPLPWRVESEKSKCRSFDSRRPAHRTPAAQDDVQDGRRAEHVGSRAMRILVLNWVRAGTPARQPVRRPAFHVTQQNGLDQKGMK